MRMRFVSDYFFFASLSLFTSVGDIINSLLLLFCLIPALSIFTLIVMISAVIFVLDSGCFFFSFFFQVPRACACLPVLNELFVHSESPRLRQKAS